MKAYLTFNLPDEQMEYALANAGGTLAVILWELDQWLRSECKYNENLTEWQNEIYEGVREKLRDIMSEYGLTFEDIIFI